MSNERYVVLDTETTGLDVRDHRVIEIACVELSDRLVRGRSYHTLLNPGRAISPQAHAVHGLRDSDLTSAPKFASIGVTLLSLLRGAILVAHSAEFDVGFINQELQLAGSRRRLDEFLAGVVDTQALCRNLHPGKRHDLGSMCRLYGIRQSGAHRALADAESLAALFIAMQRRVLPFDLRDQPCEQTAMPPPNHARPPVLLATAEEAAAHEKFLDILDASTPSGRCLWRQSLAQR